MLFLVAEGGAARRAARPGCLGIITRGEEPGKYALAPGLALAPGAGDVAFGYEADAAIHVVAREHLAAGGRAQGLAQPGHGRTQGGVGFLERHALAVDLAAQIGVEQIAVGKRMKARNKSISRSCRAMGLSS